MLAGCAAPGDPTARHPVVPAPVADLSARQVGGEIVLTFTLPARSTDREALAERPSVEVYRAALAPGAAVTAKTAWRAGLHDPAGTRGCVCEKQSNRVSRSACARRSQPRAWFSPRLHGAHAGGAGRALPDDSNILTLRVFPPPAAPGDVRTQVTESAIAIRWSETGAPAGATFAGYRVYRAQLESGQEGAPQDASQAKLKSPLGTGGVLDFARISGFAF